MADVSGKFFSATKVRTGVSPSSSGTIVGETLPPVNPPGAGLSSVGLTMPSAFSVANSPLTSNGSLDVTGAGTVAQYIRGDGSLADFPESSGGGSSVSYYLNGSVNQGTIGGVAYKELSKVPILGAGTDFTINDNGYIASFLTDAGDPNLLEIPAGNWNFETFFSANSNGGSPTFYVELYKYNGTTFTLIASSVSAPELIAFGTNLTPYFSTLAVPTTTLALTDRLAIRYYVTHSGRTITMHTENNTLCQIITTFTTGLTALNGLTAQVQNLAVGTTGTDFNIASAVATHTFNLPTASATNRGALSTADWALFRQAYNDKINSASVTGTTTKTLTLFQQDGGEIQASWSDLNTDAVTSVFGRTGAVIAVSGDYTTAQVTESGNLYYTDARSRAALSFVAGSGAYNSSTGVITIPTNNNQITNGAGYITSAALDAYLPLAGGTMTGNINWGQTDRGLIWSFNTDGASIKFYNTGDGDTDSRLEFATLDNNNEYFRWVHIPSGGSTYESMRLVANSSGNAQLIVNGSIIKQGGTSSQYLMADGSVSTLSNPVTGTGTTNYLPKFTGASTIGNSIAQEGTNVLGINITPKTYNFVSALEIAGGATIAGFSNFTFIGSNWYFFGTDKRISTGAVSQYYMTGGSHYWRSAASGAADSNITFTDAMTLTASGNLLVGTTTDNGARLQVSGAATFSSSVNVIQSNGSGFVNVGSSSGRGQYQNINFGGTLGGVDYGWQVGRSPQTGGVINDGFYIYDLKTNNAPFTIALGGNVLIGTTTDNGARLQVSGSASPNNGFFLSTNTFTLFSSGSLLRMGHVASSGNTTAIIQNLTVGGTAVGNIAIPDGNLLVGTTTDNGARLQVSGAATFSSSVTATSFFESSDASLKTLVEDNYQAKGIHSVVAKLYIKNGKEELGYYAQDLQGVLPSAVSKGSNGLLNLSYREVHTAKIAYLEQQIKQLQNELGRIS